MLYRHSNIRYKNKPVRGTNQYQKKYRVTKADRAAFKLIMITIFYATLLAIATGMNITRALQPAIISPLAKEAKAEVKRVNTSPLPTLKPTITPEPENPIEQEIREVFGEDADKALKLLKCENSSLNPNAVNTAGNYPKGSRDIGIFQINEYWQKVNAKFLFNPSINIRVAHQIYKESGDSFKMWSCSRKVGLI